LKSRKTASSRKRNPEAGVIRDSAGNLYGTTVFGGTINATCPNGCGVVYKLDTAGQETVLHSFGGPDAGNPVAGVIRDPAGNLYGTTLGGGTANAGVVYELHPSRHETVLFSFTGGTDGNLLFAGVIRDAAGNLYGTTGYGGTAGAGVVYMLDTKHRETVLYSFTGGAGGNLPAAGVTATRPAASSALPSSAGKPVTAWYSRSNLETRKSISHGSEH
jgi:uncharacterized repeat protein (TIGR03803 family)